MLGGWNNNFPVIDKARKLVNGFHQSVTSIKSIDLAGSSYQKGNYLFNTIMRYTNTLTKFTTTEYGNFTALVGPETRKILEIAIPMGATPAQMEQINKSIAEAVKLGVEVIIRIIR